MYKKKNLDVVVSMLMIVVCETYFVHLPRVIVVKDED